MKMNKKGVTMLELCVVLAIIAIAAVLTVPNLGGWLISYRLRTAARDVTSTLRVAQMRAVSNNMEYQVFIAGGSYILQRNSGGWISEGDTKSLPTGITFTGNSFPAVETTPAGSALFRPNSSSNGGTIILQNIKKKTKRTITVLPLTGRITVQ
jgi:general secretion pathway protein H